MEHVHHREPRSAAIITWRSVDIRPGTTASWR
jgi:hypothetical protein